MSYDVYGVSAYVISYDDLKKLCPQEIKKIESLPSFEDMGWGPIAHFQSYDDIEYLYDYIDCEEEELESIAEEYSQLIVQLQEAFNKKTGLTLYLDTYDSDCGSSYDSVPEYDGCIFCVQGVVEVTPAGKKYEHIIHEYRWTQGG